MNLRVPGPTPLPPAVRAAMAEAMINHRGSEFHRLMDEIQPPLRAQRAWRQRWSTHCPQAAMP